MMRNVAYIHRKFKWRKALWEDRNIISETALVMNVQFAYNVNTMYQLDL